MALLNILQFPDARLKKLAAPVEHFDKELSTFIDNLFETLYEIEGGVGLAAVQVNEARRVLVIDISPKQNQPLCLINPEIIARHGTTESEEGCLSFPGIYAKVQRAKEIEVTYRDREGNAHQLKSDGFLSICIQHEIDHLDGITFYDHLAPVKQHMLRKKLGKVRRNAL
jgi:peptide deformylase